MHPRFTRYKRLARSSGTPYSVSSIGVLREEILPLEAVGIPFERQRTVLQMGQNQVGHAVVVVENVAFGESLVGVIDFFQIGEFQGLTVDAERRLLAVG